MLLNSLHSIVNNYSSLRNEVINITNYIHIVHVAIKGIITYNELTMVLTSLQPPP